MVKVDIYFDGACHNQKGSISEPFGVGVAVLIDGEYSEIYSRAYFGEKGTSNVSEWCGCILAMRMIHYLETISEGDFPEGLDIDVYSDSQLITNQFNMKWQVSQPHLEKYYDEARKEFRKSKWSKEVQWIRREFNTKADELSKIGLKERPRTFVF